MDECLTPTAPEQGEERRWGRPKFGVRGWDTRGGEVPNSLTPPCHPPAALSTTRAGPCVPTPGPCGAWSLCASGTGGHGGTQGCHRPSGTLGTLGTPGAIHPWRLGVLECPWHMWLCPQAVIVSFPDVTSPHLVSPCPCHTASCPHPMSPVSSHVPVTYPCVSMSTFPQPCVPMSHPRVPDPPATPVSPSLCPNPLGDTGVPSVPQLEREPPALGTALPPAPRHHGPVPGADRGHRAGHGGGGGGQHARGHLLLPGLQGGTVTAVSPAVPSLLLVPVLTLF